MVPVRSLKLFSGHPEKLGGLPQISTCLHLPRRRRVPQRMWRHVRHAGVVGIAPESLVDVMN